MSRDIKRGQPNNAGQFATDTSGATRIPTTSPVRAPAATTDADRAAITAAQVARFHEQLEQMRLGRSVDRLLAADDRLPHDSQLTQPTPADEDALVEFSNLNTWESASTGQGSYEATPHGRIMLLPNTPHDGRHVVGILEHHARDHRDVLVVVATTSREEAERMYAGAVTEAAAESGTCDHCGEPIPNVYYVCTDCQDA